MPITARLASTALALALLAACSAAATSGPSPAQPSAADTPAAETTAAAVPDPAAEPSTVDGIYTMAQADRGRALFDAVCSECHETSDWTEAGFRGRWADQSVFQLWYYINDRMPYNDPFSLDRQQVTDVLAYILRLNDLPAGDAELATDDDSIDDYWIRWDTAR